MSRHSAAFSVACALLLVTILVTMSHHTEARYLPTRSDPLSAPAGPPRGEDPRFDHLYDILKELLRTAGGTDDSRFAVRSRNDAGQNYY